MGADGGVYAFGDAAFVGSLPGLHITPNRPVVGIAASPVGTGYWLVGADGGVFAFGDATYMGSGPSLDGLYPGDRAVGIQPTSYGAGYDVPTAAGYAYSFGWGTSVGAIVPNAPLVGVSS